jgi:small subunit ribosomal protein S18
MPGRGRKKKGRQGRKRKVSMRRPGFSRRKGCRFCVEGAAQPDYKEPKVLKYFIAETGAIVPRRISGTCAKHQRKVTVAVKRARVLALLPFDHRSV